MNLVSSSCSNNYPESKCTKKMYSWTARTIVDDLAEDVHNDETDSESGDDYWRNYEKANHGWGGNDQRAISNSDDAVGYMRISQISVDVGDVLREERIGLDEVHAASKALNGKKEEAEPQSASKEWTIVNDLIDDADSKWDETSDMEDSGTDDHYSHDEDYNERKNGQHFLSGMNFMNFFRTAGHNW